MTNLRQYDDYGDDLVKALAGFSGCAIFLHVWLIGIAELALYLSGVPSRILKVDGLIFLTGRSRSRLQGQLRPKCANHDNDNTIPKRFAGRPVRRSHHTDLSIPKSKVCWNETEERARTHRKKSATVNALEGE